MLEESKGTLCSKANEMLQAVICKGSRNENPSHRGEKMDCEIVEVTASLLKDIASAEYRGYTSENAMYGAAQRPSTLLRHASQALPHYCDFGTAGDGICCLGMKTIFVSVSFLFFFLNLVNFHLGRRGHLPGVGEE